MSGKEILLRARSHFRAARTVETLRKIEVPEWETAVHYWPEMSFEERKAVYAHIRAKDRTFADMQACALTQVLMRARDAYGTRMFSDEDETALADTDPAVLLRIGNEMGFGTGLTVEDAEGN